MVPRASVPSGKPPSFTVPGKWSGLVQPGNIDLANRPIVHNPDGSISTVKSFSIGVGPHEVLLPMVVGGKMLSIPAAIASYKKTGKNLGTFASVADANAYAQALHLAQAKEYLPQSGLVLPKLPISGARAGMAITPPPFDPTAPGGPGNPWGATSPQFPMHYDWDSGKYVPNPGYPGA